MKNYHLYIAVLVLLAFMTFPFVSCQDFLDAKPSKHLATPESVNDLLALLDAQKMSVNFPSSGDYAADDFYLPYENWAALFNQEAKDVYVWDPNTITDMDWLYGYSNILTANTVLAEVDGVDGTINEKNNVRGCALFFRGLNHFQLAQVYGLPYDRTISDIAMGVPLRLKADITEETKRHTMEETYQQVLRDIHASIPLLDETPLVKTRPSKAAAYGMLARIYLTMEDFGNASAYADSALQRNDSLLDYNQLDTTKADAFNPFHGEVIFHSTMSGRYGLFSPSRAFVDTALYKSYHAFDLRKKVLFRYVENGRTAFKGDYSGSNYGQLFNGIATDELYLIAAESSVRLGQVTAGMELLNRLLARRFTSTEYLYPTGVSESEALSIVLDERRKELACRGNARWNDLRRLNKYEGHQTTLTRKLNGEEYLLTPGDLRYAFLIPASVIEQTGIPQNER